ncbi:MAG: glutaredoxin 3 [Pseudomonadota bacterium]|nr:glutaredoxin 3 [Pseudomonadota bacterium]
MAKIEVYSKEWCPYCTKAKALLRSKQLEYEEIDVTSDAAGELEMVERSRRRTVPQIFIDEQSVGGYDDLAQLNATGELDRLLNLESPIDLTKVYDVAIVGAGPAGMSAAIYAVRKNLSTLIVAADIGGQLGTTYEVGNYPGFQMITGPDLVQQFEAHMDQYGSDKLVGEKVTGLRFEGRCKILETAAGREIRARSVIIASGAFKRKLNIPGETELSGKGVVYCSTCDGRLFRDMDIAIVGGGNSGLEAAIEMNGLARKIYLVSRTQWNGDPILQDKVRNAERVESLALHDPVEIHGAEQVEALTVKDLATDKIRRLDVRGVFIEIGLYPNTDFVLDLLDTNEHGEIRVDSRAQTGINGVFAAGDVTDSHDKQIVIAAGAGANAALGAFEYLVRQH